MPDPLTSTHWAHMRLLREYWAPTMLPGPGGVPYVADTHGAKMIEVQCDCSHTWSIPKEEFPGRRKLKSCGRVECPHSMPPRRRSFKTGVTSTVYFSADNHEWLQARAITTKITKSAIVNEMIDRARADELLGD